MRGTDWHVYSEATGGLHLGLLLHVLELREYAVVVYHICSSRYSGICVMFMRSIAWGRRKKWLVPSMMVCLVFQIPVRSRSSPQGEVIMVSMVTWKFANLCTVFCHEVVNLGRCRV